MKALGSAVAIAALVAVWPSLAHTQEREAYKKLGTVVNAATLDAASTTFTIDEEKATGYGLLVLELSLTDADDSVTEIKTQCKGGSDPTDINYVLQSVEMSAGTGTSYDAAISKDPSSMSTKKWAARFDIEGFPNVACTITDTGGVAADALTVKAALATKGG